MIRTKMVVEVALRRQIGLAATWLVFYCLFLVCAPGTFYFEDSPELVACAAGLGNTHPPGYPLLMLVGRLVLSIPVGSLAFRFNLFIAACAAGAAVGLAFLVHRLATREFTIGLGSGTAVTVFAGLFAAGAWGLSDAFWWEAVIGDKYAPYYLAFVAVAGVSVLTFSANAVERPRSLAVLALVTGLAFAHHQYAVFALPLVGVALWRAFVRAGSGGVGGRVRTITLMLCLGVLPLSTKGMYPPIRSVGGAELDWGRPGVADRLAPYLKGRLYHEALAASSISLRPELLWRRMKLAFRFLREELPLVIVAGAPIGIVIAVRGSPLLALGFLGCLLANVAYVLNFSEKVVRWYEPAYAILLIASALGFAWIAGRIAKIRSPTPNPVLAVILMAAVSLAGLGIQWHRGIARNDLSRFFAAHDMGRNLLRSIPEGAVYLGAGDFDLFPLWALRYVEHEREDVVAIGLASFVDPHLAGVGGQETLRRRIGAVDSGVGMLAALMNMREGPPIVVAASGYDPKLYALFPFIRVIRFRGIVGRLLRHWDVSGSVTWTRRVTRAYTYRGLRYARSGAVFDLDRVRDEVARGALMVYPSSSAALGFLCMRFGRYGDAAREFETARGQLFALAGAPDQPASETADNLPARLAAVESGRRAIVLAYHRLADVFERRGVMFLAAQFRSNAAAMGQR